MTTAARRPDPLRRPAMACGALVGLAILVAAFGPKASLPRPDTPIAQSIALRFVDKPDGTLVAEDASGRVVSEMAPGQGGFVRSTMRGLASERQRRSLGPQTPFELTRLQSGQLILSDPDTGQTIVVNAFGRANADAFAAFLDHGREPL